MSLPRLTRFWLVLALCSAGTAAAQQSGPVAATKAVLSIDPVVNLNDPFALTEQDFLAAFGDKLTPEGAPCYYRSKSTSSQGGEVLGLGTAAASAYRMEIFSGKLGVAQATFTFRDAQLGHFIIQIAPEPDLAAAKKAVLDHFSGLFGSEPQQMTSVKYSTGDLPAIGWTLERMSIRVYERLNSPTVMVSRRGSASSSPSTSPSPPPAPIVTRTAVKVPSHIAVNLDALLAHDTFWTWSADDLERQYRPRTEAPAEQPPQFEWLNAAKDRARFSRKMFSNIETRLTMFGGSIKVEEAVIEFAKGRAARATVSFYNRGDSGPMSVTQFEDTYKRIGQSLTQAMRVQARSQLAQSNAALRVTGWNWTSPSGIALLEYNDYTARTGSSAMPPQPEFLRLKLAAPGQADWSMGRMSAGVGRLAMAKNVTRNSTGDVFISGVPMVDQGAKGYCVAASCQRLFEYFEIACDQHELAKLVSVDSESGANIFTMQKSLAKIDGQFRVTFKPYINPELYYDKSGKRRVSFKEFMNVVKDQADKGAPLLWALELGKFAEVPPLPSGGQTRGGHMRIVIGYNEKQGDLLFTDSWGAGHEVKRMRAIEAYDCTLGLYSMSPRGL